MSPETQRGVFTCNALFLRKPSLHNSCFMRFHCTSSEKIHWRAHWLLGLCLKHKELAAFLCGLGAFSQDSGFSPGAWFSTEAYLWSLPETDQHSSAHHTLWCPLLPHVCIRSGKVLLHPRALRLMEETLSSNFTRSWVFRDSRGTPLKSPALATEYPYFQDHVSITDLYKYSETKQTSLFWAVSAFPPREGGFWLKIEGPETCARCRREDLRCGGKLHLDTGVMRADWLILKHGFHAQLPVLQQNVPVCDRGTHLASWWGIFTPNSSEGVSWRSRFRGVSREEGPLLPPGVTPGPPQKSLDQEKCYQSLPHPDHKAGNRQRRNSWVSPSPCLPSPLPPVDQTQPGASLQASLVQFLRLRIPACREEWRLGLAGRERKGENHAWWEQHLMPQFIFLKFFIGQ